MLDDPDIHPAEIAARFEELEREANRRPQGADHTAIVDLVADEYCVSVAYVRQVVLKHTIGEPN